MNRPSRKIFPLREGRTVEIARQGEAEIHASCVLRRCALQRHVVFTRGSPPGTGGVDATSRKCCEASFERSGRGGRSQKRGRKASRATACERPPRRFAPPLLCQEGSSRPNGFRNLDGSAFAKEGWLRLKRKWPRSLVGADGVVVSSHRLSNSFGINKR